MRYFLTLLSLCLALQGATTPTIRNPRVVDSVSVLVSIIPSNVNPDVYVNNVGWFSWNSSSTASTNTTDTFAATGYDTGRWLPKNPSTLRLDSLVVTNNATIGNLVFEGTAFENLTVTNSLDVGSTAKVGALQNNRASQLFFIGDSFTYGASATAYTNTFASLTAQSLGWSATATNIANGSFSIADANWSVFSGWTVTNSTGPSYVFTSPDAITTDQNWVVTIGFNGLRTTGPTAAMYGLGLDHLIHYLATPDSAKRWAQSPDASTGSWTPIPWSGGLGDIGAYSSSGTLTFSNVIGSEIYVGFLAWATNYGGTISVEVDGAEIDTVDTASAAYGNREYINGTDPVIPDHVGPYGTGQIDFCPHIITATGLGLGAHTVVITAASNPVWVLWCAGNGWKRAPQAGPNVFVSTIPRQVPWTGAGTDALQAAYNAQLLSTVSLAREGGNRVAVIPVGEAYDATTHQSGDGVHPDDDGHAEISEAMVATMQSDVPAMLGIGYESSGSGSGSGGVGSFSSLAVSGTSDLTGILTIHNRFLAIGTATPGGYGHRFGYGSVSASSVLITGSDSSLDREMRINGNGIYSLVNSTGADANLSVGRSGSTTAIQGPASVGGSLSVVATPGSGGTISYFGTAATTNSNIQLTHDDTALDRRLRLGGNYIYSLKNSDSSAQNLQVGYTGATVVNPGSETVAGTLGVTGAGTFLSTLGVSGLATFNALINAKSTPASGGSKSIFGTEATTNSTVTIVHDDSALDRRLVISGNLIKALVNSTGAAANLQVGQSGVSVSNPGNQSITGTLSAGGATTLNSATITNALAAGSISTTGTLAAGTTTLGALTVTNAATVGSLTTTGTAAVSTATVGTLTLTNAVVLPSGSSGYRENFIIACSDETTAITAGTNKVTFRMPYAFTLTGIRASLTTASSSGGPVTVDVNVNGSTLMSSDKLKFDDNETTTATYSGTAATLTTTALSDDDEITFDVDAAGTGAAGLKVTLIGKQ